MLFVSGAVRPADITRALAAADVWVEHLLARTPDLEQVFLSLTEEEGGRTTPLVGGGAGAAPEKVAPRRVEAATSGEAAR
jgi:hypothetical protein